MVLGESVRSGVGADVAGYPGDEYDHVGTMEIVLVVVVAISGLSADINLKSWEFYSLIQMVRRDLSITHQDSYLMLWFRYMHARR